ncbi:HAD family hydrolase [Ruania alba]|uniref:HAD-superfamily hydrolase, subfamily IIB n=1 Tax=Ruania alba TaxID=648782 RepID=A0A1H5MGY4_9MICO|nr:HAD family hydrolase [Ruania alba]SEE88564.1 HAD-superfamily hydrolase, subfamily IIB [Ruania alba]
MTTARPSAHLGALALYRPGPDLLVALDIDGTILGHDQSLSEKVRTAVGDLRASGTHVVLSTGRSLQAVLPVAEALGITDAWAVCSNGAVTIRLDSTLASGYEIHDVVTFDPGPTLRLLREHLPEGIFAVEDLGRGFALTAPFPDGELTGTLRVVDFEELCAMSASRVTMRAPGLGSDDFHELVDRSGLHGVSYAVGWTAWLDIAPEGVSKASALEQVRQYLQVGPTATVAAGDGRNDIEMLTWAGVGVAMGGADETTRGAADLVTGPVETDGLVPVLRTLLAGE